VKSYKEVPAKIPDFFFSIMLKIRGFMERPSCEKYGIRIANALPTLISVGRWQGCRAVTHSWRSYSMGLRINTNVVALGALNNLQRVSGSIAGSIEKLSSGLRINRAADDPAGLTISENLRAQIDGLNQAISNTQDAQNVIKTAEGGLTEVNSLLRSVRQLAIHAANTGVNDEVAIQADQAQITSAVSSIQRIAENTQFGSKKLLDGTAGISAAVVDTNTISAINIGSVFGGATVQNGTLNITVNNAATRAVAIGNVTFASVDATLAAANGTTTGTGGTIVLNGQSISVAGSDTVQSLIDKINSVSSATGVSANFSAGNGSGSIVLTQQNYGANFKINTQESSGLVFGTAGTNVAGSNATVTVTATGLVGGAATTVIATFTGGRAASDSGIRVTDGSGNAILLTEAGNSTNTSNYTVANVTASDLQFQIGANYGQTVRLGLGNVRANNLGNTTIAGQSLASVDVTTQTGAQNAIRITDEAIQQVSKLRANIGAFQRNTLDSVARSLAVSVENLSASESQIRDTNVATEVVSYTKNQIIQQAANSVLAQANSAPNQVLSLLRG
jgi:flagellin